MNSAQVGGHLALLVSAHMSDCRVTVILPCRDEADALPGVLAAMPDGYRPLVVDNNSTDATAEVARRRGAEVVHEPVAGYGSAVHAGVVAAATPIVAVLDADGSMDPGDLPRLVSTLEDRGADLVVGRRRPVRGLRWPWHARLGNAAVCWRLRRKHGLDGARHRPDAGGPPGGPAGARCDGPPVGVSGRAAGPRRRRGLVGGRARRRLRTPHRRQIQGERFACAAASSPRSDFWKAIS